MDTFFGPLSVRINRIWLSCNLNKRLTCTQNNVRVMSYNIIFSQNKVRGLIIWISVVIKIILILNKIRPNKKSTIYNNHCNKIHNLIVNHWVGLLHWEELPKILRKHNTTNNNIDDTTVSCINGVKEEANTISYHGTVKCYVAVRLTIGFNEQNKNLPHARHFWIHFWAIFYSL